METYAISTGLGTHPSTRGAIEGVLRTSPSLRTLDDLNLLAREFVTVHGPNIDGEVWEPDTRVAVSKASILWVVEECDQLGPRFVSPESYRRSPLRLRVDDFDVQGFMHVPQGGDTLQRLNQDRHPFIALTSASVVGSDVELAVPFLAVNRQQIAWAVELPAHVPQSEELADVGVS